MVLVSIGLADAPSVTPWPSGRLHENCASCTYSATASATKCALAWHWRYSCWPSLGPFLARQGLDPRILGLNLGSWSPLVAIARATMGSTHLGYIYPCLKQMTLVYGVIRSSSRRRRFVTPLPRGWPCLASASYPRAEGGWWLRRWVALGPCAPRGHVAPHRHSTLRDETAKPSHRGPQPPSTVRQ